MFDRGVCFEAAINNLQGAGSALRGRSQTCFSSRAGVRLLRTSGVGHWS